MANKPPARLPVPTSVSARPSPPWTLFKNDVFALYCVMLILSGAVGSDTLRDVSLVLANRSTRLLEMFEAESVTPTVSIWSLTVPATVKACACEAVAPLRSTL